MRVASAWAGALLAGLAVAMPAGAQDSEPVRHAAAPGVGEPSDVLAAELAAARLARAKGVAAALHALALPSALAVRDAGAPTPLAQASPLPELATRDAKGVWVSCDGSLAVTQGPLDKTAAAMGLYTTVWQRSRKHPAYRIVLDIVSHPPVPGRDSDFVEGHVAECPARRGLGDPAPPHRKPAKPAEAIIADGADGFSGTADDHTLAWRLAAPGTTPRFSLRARRDGAEHDVLPVADPPAPAPTPPAPGP